MRLGLNSTNRDLTLLGVLLVVIYLATANHGPFGSATRYYEAAREMAETGDWIVPQLSYVPYVEKPPLVYWLGAVARLIGDHPLLTSLPSLLSTGITLAATYLFGCWWRDRRVGLTAAGLLLGSCLTEVMAGVLFTDPLLTAALSVAWLSWWRWDRDGRTNLRWLLAFYAAIAVGWLVKGPVALALPGAAIATFAFLRGGIAQVGTTLWAMQPWWGIILIVVINGPWTMAWYLRDPRLVEFFYVHINFAAFVHGTFNHPAPWHYYGPILLGCLAPYTLCAVPLLIHALWLNVRTLQWRRTGPVSTAATDHGRLYLIAITIGTIAFLSLSSAKLGSYLMPTMPAILLLIAESICQWTIPPRWVKAVTIFQATVLLLVVALTPVVLVAIDESVEQGKHLVLAGVTLAHAADLSQIDWSFTGRLLIALSLLLIGVLGSVVAIMANRAQLAFAAMALGTTLLLALIMPISDRLMPNRDSSPLAEAIRARGGLAADHDDVILLHRSTIHEYELQLALRRPLGLWDRARETGVGFFVSATPVSEPLPAPGQAIKHPYEVSGNNTAHPRLWSDARLQDAWNSPTRIWLLADLDTPDELKKIGLTANVIATARHKALLSNRP